MRLYYKISLVQTSPLRLDCVDVKVLRYLLCAQCWQGDESSRCYSRCDVE